MCKKKTLLAKNLSPKIHSAFFLRKPKKLPQGLSPFPLQCYLRGAKPPLATSGELNLCMTTCNVCIMRAKNVTELLFGINIVACNFLYNFGDFLFKQLLENQKMHSAEIGYGLEIRELGSYSSL